MKQLQKQQQQQQQSQLNVENIIYMPLAHSWFMKIDWFRICPQYLRKSIFISFISNFHVSNSIALTSTTRIAWFNWFVAAQRAQHTLFICGYCCCCCFFLLLISCVCLYLYFNLLSIKNSKLNSHFQMKWMILLFFSVLSFSMKSQNGLCTQAKKWTLRKNSKIIINIINQNRINENANRMCVCVYWSEKMQQHIDLIVRKKQSMANNFREMSALHSYLHNLRAIDETSSHRIQSHQANNSKKKE